MKWESISDFENLGGQKIVTPHFINYYILINPKFFIKGYVAKKNLIHEMGINLHFENFGRQKIVTTHFFLIITY